jgi:hypothetical protein
MAKENKPAEAYAMNGVGVANMEEISRRDFTNKKSAYEVSSRDPAMTVSVGYNDKKNLNGEVAMRGVGAATKGTKCRGPMA